MKYFRLTVIVLVGFLFIVPVSLVSAETSLGTTIRSLENPYHADWAEGGDMYADSVGLEHVILVWIQSIDMKYT